ncbi:hypothetical protein VNO78_04113 [Psophocarpus tetragonolobus]|uniref:Uncharacterized protein n=1 Tax=Psophocarpus tetragonolobus TaxID=3891 RepID=A0AAN9T480_PSOTE
MCRKQGVTEGRRKEKETWRVNGERDGNWRGQLPPIPTIVSLLFPYAIYLPSSTLPFPPLNPSSFLPSFLVSQE